jgi:DNA/RNA-binding domain of Phe-tRNA-synthetase-like protein
MHAVRIHEKIFDAYPDFRRGIVLARSLLNSGSSKELEEMLARAIEGAAADPIDIKTDPRTLPWLEAHRRAGSNPNKFPPAHCALLKRVQKKGARIPFINKSVAIMNCNSIRDIIPVGGDDLEKAGGTLELRYADGSETFTPLGQPDVRENPDPGEIIYVVPESGEVMCRRWNWRNGHRTLIGEDTRVLVMNIDGLGEDSEGRALATRDRVAGMFETFCGAEVTTALLTPSEPSFSFEV